MLGPQQAVPLQFRSCGLSKGVPQWGGRADGRAMRGQTPAIPSLLSISCLQFKMGAHICLLLAARLHA